MSTIAMHVARTEADLERLQEAARCAVEAYGFEDAVATALFVSLDEILSNVVLHGVGEGGCEVRVSLVVSEAEVVVTIEDDGGPFDPLSYPPPDLEAPLEERQVGGLGIHLVRELMDEARYERAGPVNRLVLRKGR